MAVQLLLRAVGRGTVLYLDAYVTRLELVPGRTPFTIKDLVDVHPHAILLGHGHADNADNAAYIAAKPAPFSPSATS